MGNSQEKLSANSTKKPTTSNNVTEKHQRCAPPTSMPKPPHHLPSPSSLVMLTQHPSWRLVSETPSARETTRRHTVGWLLLTTPSSGLRDSGHHRPTNA